MRLTLDSLRGWDTSLLGSFALVMLGAGVGLAAGLAARDRAVSRAILEPGALGPLPAPVSQAVTPDLPVPPAVIVLPELALREPPFEPLQAPASPRYTYATGPRGVGYYPTSGPQAVSRPSRPAATGRPATVGPGARNWTTGNRISLHRPWLRSRR
jgi:hypothetical protein